MRPLLPGLLACVGLAVAARWLGTVSGVGIETALALVLGLVVGAIARARDALAPGAAAAARVALRVGITLLGARLTLDQIAATGIASLAAIVVVVASALVIGALAARPFAVAAPMSWLVTVGMAICGNSAILAMSPIVRAPGRDTAYAVSTITLFGLVGVLLLPLVGRALGMSDAVLGTWAGLSVNDTAQVVAAGYAYSAPAGDVATVVKLTRNIAILPVLVGAAWLVARADRAAASPGAATAPDLHPLRWLTRAVPWFVIGFVVFAGLRTAGALDGSIGDVILSDALSVLAGLLILVALAGVGLGTDLRAMLAAGPRPFLLGTALWIAILVMGAAAATVVGAGLP